MVGGSDGFVHNVCLAFRRWPTVRITGGIFGFCLPRRKVTFVDFLEFLECTRRRPNAIEDIIDNCGYPKAGEESHFVDSCGLNRYGSAGCDCVLPGMSDGQARDHSLAPAKPTTLMRIPAMYAAYALGLMP